MPLLATFARHANTCDAVNAHSEREERKKKQKREKWREREKKWHARLIIIVKTAECRMQQ